MISTAGSQQYSKEAFDVLRMIESKLSDNTPGSIIESYPITESLRNCQMSLMIQIFEI